LLYLNGFQLSISPPWTQTFYEFSGLSPGVTYNLGVRAVNSAGVSPNITPIFVQTAPPTPVQYTYSIFYNANGGSGSTQTTTTTSTNTSVSLTVASNQFTRSGFVFSSWNANSSGTGTTYFPGNGIILTASSPSITLFAQWGSGTPVFSDTTITTDWFLGRNYDAAPDRTVAASPVTGYSVVYAGPGLNPTNWLVISSSGQLSGTPPQVGQYTFLIRAINGTVFTDTQTYTLNIAPPGKRFADSTSSVPLTTARRFDGTNWVNLSLTRRFDGTNWIDISNN
jgi:hypothetical protein